MNDISTEGMLDALKNEPSLAEVRDVSRLADEGDAHAQFKLGLMFGFGRGMTRDNNAAAKWFKAAAKQGYFKAQYNYGVMNYRPEMSQRRRCIMPGLPSPPTQHRQIVCVLLSQHKTGWQMK